MRHTEISKSPCQCRENLQQAVRRSCSGSDIVRVRQAEVSGHGFCIVHNGTETADFADTKTKYNNDCDRHNNTLDKVCRTCCEESAQCGVSYDNDCTDQHCRQIIHSEQVCKQLAAGCKSGSRIRYKENDDQQCCDYGKNTFVISVTVGKEQRQCRRISADMRIITKSLGNNKPVYISSDCQSDCSPRCISRTGQVSNARQSHQQPAAHVRGLGTHGGDERSQCTSAEIEVICGLILFCQNRTDTYHRSQVDQDCDQH